MRVMLPLSCLLLLLVVSSSAGAQSEPRKEAAAAPGTQSKATAKPGTRSAQQTKDIMDRGKDFLAQCMKDWEPATHISKQQWNRTCKRVVQERVKFLLEQPE